MNIGKLLKCYREVNQMSIRDLSKKIGLTIATLSRVENGKPVDLRITLVFINWLFGEQKIAESPNIVGNKQRDKIKLLWRCTVKRCRFQSYNRCRASCTCIDRAI